MRTLVLIAVFAVFWASVGWSSGFVVDHTATDLSAIPDAYISKAKSELHIVYTHTSHGSQLISGMNGLESYPPFGDRYAWKDTAKGDDTSLSLDDRAFAAPQPDLSQGDRDEDGDGIADWANFTADLLQKDGNEHINVIMWSWCNIAGHDIERYLRSMEWLIGQFGEGGGNPRASEHPVQFVFMTGHANGGGENDSSDSQNRKIRKHCRERNRILFDFADIENYDPDGNYYLDRNLDDALYYDGDGDGSRESNWASEYLDRHADGELDRLTTGDGVDGYDGIASCAHSPEGSETPDARLNCVLKGRATWHLFARLAGWTPDDAGDVDDGHDDPEDPSHPDQPDDPEDHPGGETPGDHDPGHPDEGHHARVGPGGARMLLLQHRTTSGQ